MEYSWISIVSLLVIEFSLFLQYSVLISKECSLIKCWSCGLWYYENKSAIQRIAQCYIFSADVGALSSTPRWCEGFQTGTSCNASPGAWAESSPCASWTKYITHCFQNGETLSSPWFPSFWQLWIVASSHLNGGAGTGSKDTLGFLGTAYNISDRSKEITIAHKASITTALCVALCAIWNLVWAGMGRVGHEETIVSQ